MNKDTEHKEVKGKETKYFSNEEFDKIINNSNLRTGIGKPGFDKDIPEYKNKTANDQQINNLLELNLETSKTLNLLHHLHVKETVKKITEYRKKQFLEKQKEKNLQNPKRQRKNTNQVQRKTNDAARNIKNAARGLDIK